MEEPKEECPQIIIDHLETCENEKQDDLGVSGLNIDPVAAHNAVAVEGIPSHVSFKQLQDFFLFYCGPTAFITVDRNTRSALVYFATEISARSALALKRTYISADTPVVVKQYNPTEPSYAKLTKLFTIFLHTHPTSPFPSPCASPLPSRPDGENVKQEIKDKTEEQGKDQIHDKEPEKEKEKEELQVDNGDYREDTLTSASQLGAGGTQNQKVVIVKKRSNTNAPTPITRLEFEKAKVSYQRKGVLYNFRDITFFPSSDSTAYHVLHTEDGRLLRSGLIYRSACWSRTGESTPEDVQAVFEFLQASCQICTLIDLRTKSEKKEDKLDKVVEELYPTVPINSQLYHYVSQQDAFGMCKRFAIDLVTRNMKLRGLVWSAPTSVYFRVIYAALARRRSRAANKTPLQKTAQAVAALMPKLAVPALPAPNNTVRRNSQDDMQLALTTQRKDPEHARAALSMSTELMPVRESLNDTTHPTPASTPTINNPTTTTTTSTTTATDQPHEKTQEPFLGKRKEEDQKEDEDEEEEEEEELMLDDDFQMLMDSFDEPLEAETASQTFVQRVFNPLGLLGFTKLLIIHSSREIGHVLRICIDRRNHPLLFHCTSGKDRTGLVAALILTICGVPRDLIVDTYHLSERYLLHVSDQIKMENRSKGLDDNFDGTPKFVMRGVLAFIEEKFGSIPKYLNDMCHFTYVEQDFLRQILVSDLRDSDTVQFDPPSTTTPTDATSTTDTAATAQPEQKSGGEEETPPPTDTQTL